jgi:3alpha(or 20beta)-hydroxysteroid dehydrogenase
VGLNRLAGKIAIVTGAARGQGEAQARLFAEEGARVLLADRLVDEGNRVAASIGPAARFVDLDVTSEEAWGRAIDTCIESFGDPTILVNNAGLMHSATIEETSAADFRRLFEVNMLGALLGIQAVLPAMKRAGTGSIVNVSSANGLMPAANLSAYASTKAGLTALTRTAALELGGIGIRVNSIHPGAMENQMGEYKQAGEAQRLKFYEKLPMLRPGKIEETARMVLFVASDEASYATGSAFVSDGGMLAGVL